MRANVNDFWFDRETGTFTAEASDLARIGSEIFHRLYDDACDIGITIVNDKTGRWADFFLYAIDKDQEGDIACWKLAPTYETKRRIPGATNLKVVIFND